MHAFAALPRCRAIHPGALRSRLLDRSRPPATGSAAPYSPAPDRAPRGPNKADRPVLRWRFGLWCGRPLRPGPPGLLSPGNGSRARNRRQKMAAIGYVTRNGNGFKGQLRTLSIRTDVEIIPNSRKNGSNQPDYRVRATGVAIGAGWIRISETSGKEDVSQDRKSVV